MGLDFSYLLYFERARMWNALQGVAKIAEIISPPTKIHFPDHELSIPLDSWISKEKEVHYDDPEFSFAIALYFEEDEDIEDYIFRLYRGVKDTYHSPPVYDEMGRVPIGYIYLAIYNNLPRCVSHKNPAENMVLFDFGTTGTRMSLLFDNSTSIRKTFVELLEKYIGVCGVFNREDGGGELFWLKGQGRSEYIGDAYMMPDEIEEYLE